MALHKAILKGDFLVTRRLVECGADVNARDSESRTPLMLCCLHDNEDWALGVARMLLAHGGRVGSCDPRGRSALVYAVLYQRVGLVQLFLRALNFDLSVPDRVGGTALGYAAQAGHQTIETLLLQTLRRYGWSERTSGRGAITGVARVQPHRIQNSQSDSGVRTSIRPYKTLSDKLWTNRESLRRTFGLKHLPTAQAAAKMVRDEREEMGGGRLEGKGGSGGKSCPLDWRLDMRSLMEVLQEQSSTSYRLCAQLRPQPPRPRRRLRRNLVSSGLQGALHQRRQSSRKMSLGALDDAVRGEKLVRRRCTVAVIPPIWPAGGRRSSLASLNELRLQGKDKVMRSKSSEKITLPKVK